MPSRSYQPFQYFALTAAACAMISADAAVPPLANAPVNQLNLVPPNILFVMDRSGSMDWENVPDEYENTAYSGYYYHGCNKLAYNPNFTYLLPVNELGATLPAPTFSAAWVNGYLAQSAYGATVTGTRNLTTTGNDANSNSSDNGSGRPYRNFYYTFTGTGTAPSVYTDSRCRETMPGSPAGSTSPGNTTNFTRVLVSSLTAAQQQNYAIWYSYYRKRIFMMKSAVGQAFLNINPSNRFGFFTIDTSAANLSSMGNTFVPMATYDATQKANFYTRFYKLDDSSSTPLLAALSGAGLYYAGKYGHDPMLPNNQGGECQRNFTILSTDGYWNNSTPNPIGCSGCTADLSSTPTSSTFTQVGNVDNDAASPFSPRSGTGVTDGRHEGTTASNTLADVALYYFKSDLRPSFRKLDPHRGEVVDAAYPDTSGQPGLCTPYPTAVPAGGHRCLTDIKYRNMTTYTVGIGVAGTLKFVDDYLTNTNSSINDFVNIKAGTKNWPAPSANNNTTVDDLWHAAVNGHGSFFSAGDPASMSQGLSNTLNFINADLINAVAPTSASPAYSADNNVNYKSFYRSGSWTGRFEAELINPATGAYISTLWKAQVQLDKQAGAYDRGASCSNPVPAGVTANGWDTNRRIILGVPGGTAVPFRWANLTAAQQSSLTDGITSPADYGQRVLNYIRGSQADEEAVTGVHAAGCNNTKYFRGRGDDTSLQGGEVTQGILGDAVNSKAVIVTQARAAYGELENPGYDAFKAATANRTPMAYIGANDGMLHAFNISSTGSGNARTATANSGKEEWAYIPSMLLRNTTDELGAKNGLQSYGYPVAGSPLNAALTFQKHYFLDGTPVQYDVDFARTDVGLAGTPLPALTPDWRSLLVGSLNKGGKGYFALDVTRGDVTNAGAALTEANTASKFLWEFTGDADMGFSYGNAVVSRSQKYGWIVAVSSGYNNSTGNGAIWILNAKTGAIIKKFQIASSGCTTSATVACYTEPGLSASNPLNLGKLTGYVFNLASEKLLAIYAGDMQGNVWRMDVSDESAAGRSNWSITKLAKLTSPSGNGVYGNTSQPITAAPTLVWDQPSDRRWVFVGTGMDLSRDDRDPSKPQANQVQTMYALVDGTGSTGLPLADLPLDRSDLASQSRSATAEVDITTKKGWYIDLAAPNATATPKTLAERIVLQPAALLGTLIFGTNIPANDLCAPGYAGNVYARGYQNGYIGASLIQATTGGSYVPFVQSNEGFAANPRLVKLAGGSVQLETSTIRGATSRFDIRFTALAGRTRVSWRELLTD